MAPVLTWPTTTRRGTAEYTSGSASYYNGAEARCRVGGAATAPLDSQHGSVRFQDTESRAGSRLGILLLQREEKNDTVPALRRPHNY